MEGNMEKALLNYNEHTYYNLRFERKFVFENGIVEDLIDSTVLGNNYFFEEIYHKRIVNNIYFDDHNLTFYKQNVSGDGTRLKYRLRWYGTEFTDIQKPTLEIKKKFGITGDKYSYKIPHLKIDLSNTNRDSIIPLCNQAIEHETLSQNLSRLQPTLYNSYERRYFLSSCGNFRITVDYNMRFYNPNYKNFISNECFVKNHDVILELKYSMEHDNESRELTQCIGVRLNKNSKYVRGIDLIYL